MAYPTTLDSFADPIGSDQLAAVGPTHAELHQLINAATEALEAKVGVDSSAVTTTHTYKLSGVTGSDKAVSLAGTETLTNKTLTSPKINDTVVVTASSTELNYLDGVTAGTAVASLAVVLDSNKDFNFGTGDVAATLITATTQVVTDVIAERTADAGVTIDGTLIKDEGIILNNVKFLQGKQSGGTIKNLVGMDADNHLVLGALRRQGGSATDFSNSGTTNYTSDGWFVQCGRVNVNGSSSTTVTFPQAFGAIPLVFVTPFSAVASTIMTIDDSPGASTTQCTIQNNDGSARAAQWFAIGPI